MTTTHPAYPSDVHGMLDVAEALTEELFKTQEMTALFAAVLAVVHAVEWDEQWKRETAKYDSRLHEDFRVRHPAWDQLRQIANGMKHAT